LFERYLDALDQRFFSILKDDTAQLLGLESQESPHKDSSTPPATSSSSPVPDSPPSPAAATTALAEASKSDAEPAKQAVRQPIVSLRQLISHTRLTFNSRDCVEEHREKVTGSGGETRIGTRRRLGDRWYENEVCTDKEGKRTERKTWHSDGDEDIDRFKLEWNEKQIGKAKFETRAVTNEPNANANISESPGASGESHS
jgi:hypothetical protein